MITAGSATAPGTEDGHFHFHVRADPCQVRYLGNLLNFGQYSRLKRDPLEEFPETVIDIWGQSTTAQIVCQGINVCPHSL